MELECRKLTINLSDCVYEKLVYMTEETKMDVEELIVDILKARIQAEERKKLELAMEYGYIEMNEINKYLSELNLNCEDEELNKYEERLMGCD